MLFIETVRRKRKEITEGTDRGRFETFLANLLWFCRLSLDLIDMPFTWQYKSQAQMHLASQLCLNRIKISISWVEIGAVRGRAPMPTHGSGENPISWLSSSISLNLWPPLWHINTQRDLLKGIYVTRLDFLLCAGWDLIRVDFNLGLGLSTLILHRKYSNTFWPAPRPVTRCLNLTSSDFYIYKKLYFHALLDFKCVRYCCKAHFKCQSKLRKQKKNKFVMEWFRLFFLFLCASVQQTLEMMKKWLL